MNFDKIMILTSYGVQDIQAHDKSIRIPESFNKTYGMGYSMVPSKAILYPSDNPMHPKHTKSNNCVGISDFKGKKLIRINTPAVCRITKLNAEELLQAVYNLSIPHERATVNNKLFIIYYKDEIEQWVSMGKTKESASQIIKRRYS